MSLISRANHKLAGRHFAGCPGRCAMEQLHRQFVFIRDLTQGLKPISLNIAPEAVNGAHRSYAPTARCRHGAGPGRRRARIGAANSAGCGRKPRRAPRICRPKTRSCSRWRMPRPTKWHRAHVTWFFEQFLLVPHDPGYEIFDERFPLPVQLLLRRRRSAPRAPAARPDHAAERRRRRRLSRACRCRGRAADRDRAGRAEPRAVFSILEIGLHHEQQHQELLLTDILHAFAQNPTDPGLRRRLAAAAARRKGRAALSMCRPASIRSATTARASASTTRRRGTTS